MTFQIFEHIETFFLILIRVSGVFSTAPVLGSESIPGQVRVASALLISVVILPIQLAAHGPAHIPPGVPMFALIVIKELLIGILFGFTATIAIEGIRLAGEIANTQLGFSMVQVFDPESLQEESIIEFFNFLIFLLIFLAVNGHHLFIEAIAKSLQSVPLGQVVYSKGFFGEIIGKVPEVFILSLKLSVPVVVPIVFIMIVLGIISRAVPRIEVFMLSFPVNIMVGFFVITLYMPEMMKYIKYLIYTGIFDEIMRVIYLLR